MTRNQAKTIQHIEAELEAQRFEADQAAREQPALDPRSVWYAVQVKLAEGRIDEARALVQAWRAGRGAE